MLRSLVLRLVLALFALAPTAASAIPVFDVIVPTHYRVDTVSNIGLSNGSFGWIISTGDTITVSDLTSAIISHSIDDSAVTVIAVMINEGAVAPLTVGEVGGASNALNPAYNALLLGGESLIAPGVQLWGLTLLYPNSYTGTATLDTTLQIGDQTVTFQTTVQMGNLPTQYRAAQRLTSVPVPEPGTALLIALGIGGLAATRRR